MYSQATYLKQLKIALDFDETYTEDPLLWDKFVATVKQHGHDIRFVTFRYPVESEGIEKAAKKLEIPIIYTSRQQKRMFWDADIWIDDHPELIPITTPEQVKISVLNYKKVPPAVIKEQSLF